MTTEPASTPRAPIAVAWRILVVMLPLAVGLPIAAAVLPAVTDPSEPTTLALRIVAGVVISILTLTVIGLLVHRLDRQRWSDVGLARPGTGWRLAMGGAVIWTVPAAATFAVLGLLGMPLSATAAWPDLIRTVALLLVAVLLTEAIPEEAVFRGYITTTLTKLTRGWTVIIVQTVLFTLFAGLVRQNWNPMDLSLFVAMGIGLGYLRMTTGSVWLTIGFHAAFQTGSQLVLTHDAVAFAGGTGAAMLALGVVPFAVAAVVVSNGIPRFIDPRPRRSG